MAPAANDARYSERNKKVSDGREKYLGSFVWCIKNTHLLTSINKNSFGGGFLLSASACFICNTAAADSDGWLCYFFGMQGTVNMLNGAILNMFLSWPFSLNHSGTSRHLLQDQQIHWPTTATHLEHLQFSVVSLLRHVMSVVDPLTASLQDEKLFEKLAQHAETWNYSDFFDFSAASQQLMSLKDW